MILLRPDYLIPLMTLLSILDAKDWLNVILAIVGILVSGIGLIIAIRQIRMMRKTAEAVQIEVKEFQKKIRQTLDSNDIGRTIKNLEQAIEYVSRDEYSHALTRMMDVKSMIENDAVICKFLPNELHNEYDYHKRRFKESFKIVSSDVLYPGNIDRRMIQSSLVEIHETLIKVENMLKASVYD